MAHICNFKDMLRTFIWREPEDFNNRFHKTKTRAYIKNLRHGSLHINIFCEYVKFYVGEISREIS